MNPNEQILTPLPPIDANPSMAVAGRVEPVDGNAPLSERDLLIGYSQAAASLRAAASEALLAGALLLAIVQREGYENQIRDQETRFRAALEGLRGALA